MTGLSGESRAKAGKMHTKPSRAKVGKKVTEMKKASFSLTL
jgi:hypothetical protein